MKKHCFLTFAAMFFMLATYAQYGLGGVDGGAPQWIKLGNLTLGQGGNNCFIKITGGNGYNAQSYQQGNIEIYMRTSNWSSLDANGFGFSATASCFGQNKFASDLRIVPQGGSGGNATSYDIYAYWAAWRGNSFYTVESTGTWTNTVSIVSADPGGYVVPFQYFVANDAYFLGAVAIGALNPVGKLNVNGMLNIGAPMNYQAFGSSTLHIGGTGNGVSTAPLFVLENSTPYNGVTPLLESHILSDGTNNPELAITTGNRPGFLKVQSDLSDLYLTAHDRTIVKNMSGAELMSIGSNGRVGMGTPNPNVKLQVNSDNSGTGYNDWVAGNFGAASGDRLVVGLLDGRATIGAHNNGLTAWSDIAINPFGGRVGIGIKNPSAALDVGGQIQISATNAASPPADLSYGLFPYSGIGLGIFAGATGSNQGIGIWTNGGNQKRESVRITADGNVGIGTTDPQGYQLAVNGNAIANSMTVKLYPWHDYVFERRYVLMPLKELADYVHQYHHLPEIPSAAEVEKDGLDLGKMNGLLVKKVEELTLYLIEKEKEIKDQNERLKRLEDTVRQLAKARGGDK